MDQSHSLKIYSFSVHGHLLITHEAAPVFEINGKMSYLMILINSSEIKLLGKIEVPLYKH